MLEARARLREGFTARATVDELVKRVGSKRGERAAEQLRQDMRDQWRIRGTWLEQSTNSRGNG